MAPVFTRLGAPMGFPIRRLFAAHPRAGTGFWLFAAHLASIFGIALSNLLVCLLIALVAARRLPLFRLGSGAFRLLLPLLVYVAASLLSVAGSFNPGISARSLGDLLSLAVLPLALLLVEGEREVRWIVSALTVMTVVFAGYGIVQYLFTDLGPIDRRIPGPFSHYMTFSGVLLLGGCLILGRLVAGGGWRSAPHWLGLAMVMITLVLTLTRNAWVAALVVVSAAVLYRARSRMPVFGSALVLAGLLLANLAPGYWQRFRSIADLEDPSNYDRLCMVWAGAHMVAERPLFGLGPDMVEQRYPIYRHPTAPVLNVQHLHNTYLDLAAERGLLGLGAYLWLMIAGSWAAWRGYRAEGGIAGARADLYLAVLFGLLAFHLAGVFEANWRDSEVQRWLLFLVALPVCLGGAEATPIVPAEPGPPRT